MNGIMNYLDRANKDFSLNKITRFLLFLFFFFFIFKIIDHILFFFDISRENGYAYFSWFTLIFFLFILLPTNRSRLTDIQIQNINEQSMKKAAAVAATAAAAAKDSGSL